MKLSELIRKGKTEVATLTVATVATDTPDPMTEDEEAAIRAWLNRIEETDQAVVADILERCRSDDEAREYFIWRAK